MPKLSYKNIDVSKGCTVTVNLRKGPLVFPLVPDDVYQLSSDDVEKLVCGWIKDNSKWRGTFNKALEHQDSRIIATFEYGELIRMLCCHGHPCTYPAAVLLSDIANWMHEIIPITQYAPSMWYKELRERGEHCTYVFFFERLSS